MNNFIKLLFLVLVTLLAGCNSTGGNEENGGLPLNSHEHKLLLNPDKFGDLGQGFEAYWDIVVATAEAHELQVIEFDKKHDQKHNQVAFYDTDDLQLSSKGFLIRKRSKVKDGSRDEALTLTLKFKSTTYAAAAAADLVLAEGYKPKQDEIEVEADIINGPNPDSEPSTFYSVQNSTVLDMDPGSTLADYVEIFPVLGTLGLALTTELVPVNGVEIDEYIVKPGRIDFGNDLFGRVDMSVWIFNGKMIPEFSFDHPLDGWESVPPSSVDQCELFVGLLQSAAPEWCVDGKLKAAFVFEK